MSLTLVKLTALTRYVFPKCRASSSRILLICKPCSEFLPPNLENLSVCPPQSGPSKGFRHEPHHQPLRYSPLAKGVRGLYSKFLPPKSSSNLNDIVSPRLYMGSSVFADHQWQLLRQLWHNLRVRNGRYGSKQCSTSKTSVHASSQPVLDPRNRQEIVSIGGTCTSGGPQVHLE